MTTLEQQASDHWREIRGKQHKPTYQFLGLAAALVVGVWVGANLFGSDGGMSYTTNLYTEILSIIVTVGIVNWYAGQRATRQRKAEMFLQLGSQSNDFALEAKRQLEHLGWLDEALKGGKFPRAGWRGIVLEKRDLSEAGLIRADLQGAQLNGANLTGADLKQANLTGAYLMIADIAGADLTVTNLTGAKLGGANLTGAQLLTANLTVAILAGANLTGADLGGANLTDAVLRHANLTGAKLVGANLTGANLTDANLTGAKLWAANLTGASLRGANLTGADLREATLENADLSEATLPDGSEWTPGTDMARFTDRKHPHL